MKKTVRSVLAEEVGVPVVGIGASAGGLDPIREFLSHVPSDSGMAYVVVQHLDPSQRGMLPELLQRVTNMRVQEIGDGMEVRANWVYVIPPNKDLGLRHGVLTLRAPTEQRGRRLPIDAFFRALAEEQQARATAVVLSGMGSDGTKGLLAVKQRGGLTVAQLPESAKFDPMPRSAIGSGGVDLIALPRDMPPQILTYWKPPTRALAQPHPPGIYAAARRRDSLLELYQLLLKQTGADFADYKLNTVLRRIERRMKLRQLRALEDYVDFLRANPGEIDLLFKELLIGVTHFFRDPKVWEHLKAVVLPQLLAAHPDGLALKAWVPACSTGEEAYSLAIVYHEVLERLDRRGARDTLQIFATDLDPDAIDRARLGVFGTAIEEEMAGERLRRYFVRTEQGYRIRKDLRNYIIFAQQNVISDPPFTKLDLLCCRNLLIYFNSKLQEQLIPLFHYALRPGGLLMLGSADTPGHFTDLFGPVAGTSRLYQRLDGTNERVTHYFPTRGSVPPASHPSEVRTVAMSGNNIQTQFEQLLLKKHTPAAVLLNQHGDILYIHGRIGPYLEPAAGKANWNIHAMARASLRYELADLIKRAAQSEGMLVARGLIVSDAAGGNHALDLSAEALRDADLLSNMIVITFTSVALPPRRRSGGSNPRLLELEQQLNQARMEIQAVRNEMQASREELKSANEELQSTNEELQSTNEELTTSKEEMQSLNEELYTVNAELQSKVDDLSLANGDMKNLLNSTDIATIFLDSALSIRRYTNQATQIFKLIPTDLNRPLSDIVHDLDYPMLESDAQEVLRTLVFCERQIPTRNGRWFTVRIMPYRTVDNVIDGLVVTFVNITDFKLLEARLRAIQGGGAPA